MTLNRSLLTDCTIRLDPRNRRFHVLPFALLLRLGLLLLAGAWIVSSAARAADRTNILFIAVDDLNDWVGFLHGHPQTRTPNMDRLAARGVVFANAHCAAPLCCPSRAAVFSGRQPWSSGVLGNEDDIRRIAPGLVLLPQHFQANGYRALGTGKQLHQKRADLFDESYFTEQRWSPFDPKQVNYTAEELPSKATDNPRHVVDLGPGQPKVVLPLNHMPSDRAAKSPGGESFDWGPLDVEDAAMGDTRITDWAVKQLGAASAKPIFLAVGFYRPHIPLFVPRKYFEPFPVGSIKLPLTRDTDLADLSAIGQQVALEPVTAGAHETVVKHEQWPAAVAAYLACVHYVDAQIGRLLDALDASPQAQNTVIVLWGDHGWHLGEKQHWGKWTGWERATRVPLVVAPAARDRSQFAAGRVSQQPVGLIDLYPTLIDLCGVNPLAGLEGESLKPLLRDPSQASSRRVVTCFDTDHFSVRDARWRYIRYRDGAEELYDLHADPNEWHNLAAQTEYAAIKAALGEAVPTVSAPPMPALPKAQKKKSK